jgi:hypothetical protein
MPGCIVSSTSANFCSALRPERHTDAWFPPSVGASPPLPRRPLRKAASRDSTEVGPCESGYLRRHISLPHGRTPPTAILLCRHELRRETLHALPSLRLPPTRQRGAVCVCFLPPLAAAAPRPFLSRLLVAGYGRRDRSRASTLRQPSAAFRVVAPRGNSHAKRGGGREQIFRRSDRAFLAGSGNRPRLRGVVCRDAAPAQRRPCAPASRWTRPSRSEMRPAMLVGAPFPVVTRAGDVPAGLNRAVQPTLGQFR